MKRFLIKTAIFSAIILCLLGLGELAVRNMPSSYSYKHAYMEGHARDISTLILGSSHTYYGVRSDLLGDSVFNLANVSQDPDIDLVLLRTYMDSMPGLRLVVLPVSYFTFAHILYRGHKPLRQSGLGTWFRSLHPFLRLGRPGCATCPVHHAPARGACGGSREIAWLHYGAVFLQGCWVCPGHDACMAYVFGKSR